MKEKWAILQAVFVDADLSFRAAEDRVAGQQPALGSFSEKVCKSNKILTIKKIK